MPNYEAELTIYRDGKLLDESDVMQSDSIHELAEQVGRWASNAAYNTVRPGEEVSS
jgi:hypothetical protein